MKNEQFSFVELLVVIAIFAILAGMLLPALNMARTKARWVNFTTNTQKELDTSKELFTWKEFRDAYKNEVTAKELTEISHGDMKVTEATAQPIVEALQSLLGNRTDTVMATGDLYDQWSQFTGNPKKLTKQQFELLKEKDLIKELQFRSWSSLTGNPQKLSEKEFDALKEGDAITFPVKVKVEVKTLDTPSETTKENW